MKKKNTINELVEMKRIKFVYAVMFLLLGCSDIKDFHDPEIVHVSNEYVKEICCIIAGDGFSRFQDNKPINIQNTINEIKQYKNLECFYNTTEDVWECSSQDKDKEDSVGENRCQCRYLGKWRGCDVIFYYFYNNMGTGRFTSIFLCKVKDGNLTIEKSLFVGDRAMDGIMSTPVFDGKNSIYFYCNLSTDAVANIKGIKGKYPFQSANGFWNVSKCVYNLETDKFKILDLTITQKDECSEFFKSVLMPKLPATQQSKSINTNGAKYQEIQTYKRDK